MFNFRRNYLFILILLLLVEVAIAIFIKDKFIRPHVGDILVVILVYTCIRSFLNVAIYAAAVPALLFCYLIEILQYFNIVKMLRLENSKIASTAIGHSFDWIDLLMYSLGILIVLVIEKVLFLRNEVETDTSKIDIIN